MIVDFIVALLKKSKLARDFALLLTLTILVFGTYEGGKFVGKRAYRAAVDANNQMLSGMQKQLQGQVNDQLGKLQSSIDSGFSTINKSLEINNANINGTRDKLNNFSDVWLRVEGVRTQSSTGDKGSSDTGTRSQSGNNDAYYARLPNSSLQFLKGEAYRADQCVVRLTGAQSLVSEYQKDIKEYQDAIQNIIAQSKINKKDTLVK